LPTTNDLFKTPEDWTREGMLFTRIGSETLRDIWLAPVSGGGQPKPLIQTSFGEYNAIVSPDGRWVAYLSNEGGTDDVYIQSFPATGHKVRVSSSGASEPRWMPGSDEICYRSANGPDIMSVKLTRNGDNLDAGAPRPLFHLPPDII